MEESYDEDVESGDQFGPQDDDAGEDRWIVCAYCDTELEIDTEEFAQGWYSCPECGQLSHLADTDYETANPVFQFPGGDENVKWVQVVQMAGAEEAALEVSYLRANSIEAFAWQKGGGQAFDLTGGGIGAFYVMVRKDQEQKALAVRGNLVECEHCLESLEISDQEVTQEWFVCPVCQGTSYMGDTVTCLSCGSQVDLEEAERERGWYRCPVCDQLVLMTVSNKQVNCGFCNGNLELSDQEAIQGWFFCPMCHEMGYLGSPVTCLSCGNRKDLEEAEWQQGWYRCPKCEQITHLVVVDVSAEVADTAPESLDQVPDDEWIQPDDDWVQLKQVTSAEEAEQLISCLGANGIEAFTRRGSAKGAFGLAIDTLSTFHVVVREDQKQFALALLEAEVDEDQHSHSKDDRMRPDTFQAGSN